MSEQKKNQIQYFNISNETCIIRNVSQLMKELNKCDKLSKPMIIKAGASWCGHTKGITPIFKKQCLNYPHMRFLEFNVDEVPQLKKYFDVRDIPYFLCLLPKHNPDATTRDLRLVSGCIEEFKKWLHNVSTQWEVFFKSSNNKNDCVQNMKEADDDISDLEEESCNEY